MDIYQFVSITILFIVILLKMKYYSNLVKLNARSFTIPHFLASILICCFIAPIYEEYIFRVKMFELIDNYTFFQKCMITSLIFGLLHRQNVEQFNDIKLTIGKIILTFIMGMCFCAFSFYISVVLHSIFNATIICYNIFINMVKNTADDKKKLKTVNVYKCKRRKSI